MIEGYRIELARRDQIVHLQAIELAAAKLFSPAVLPAKMRDQALPQETLIDAQTSGRLWVAVDANGQPVGFAMASLCGKVALLDEVDVHPHHQRRGLGRALVQTVIAWASAKALSGIALTTFLELPWNAPFYQRLGFRVLARDATPEWLARQLEHEETLGLRGRVAMQFSFPSPTTA
jgi:GNAT superfamily N-acetyltransferase